MGKTRKIGGNNLQNINASLFQNAPKNALIYPGVPNFFNEKRGVSFINKPTVHPLYQNKLLAKMKISQRKNPMRFKSMGAEMKPMRQLGKEYGMSNAEIEESLENVRNQWHNYRKPNRRTAVRRGNLMGLTAKNISDAHANITRINKRQQYAENYAKFMANLNMNTITGNTSANLRRSIKSRIPANIKGNARNYFNVRINTEFKN
jgi:hypothetical protein